MGAKGGFPLSLYVGEPHEGRNCVKKTENVAGREERSRPGRKESHTPLESKKIVRSVGPKRKNGLYKRP